MAEQLTDGYHTLPDPRLAQVRDQAYRSEVIFDWPEIVRVLRESDDGSPLGAAKVIAAAYLQGKRDVWEDRKGRIPSRLTVEPIEGDLAVMACLAGDVSKKLSDAEMLDRHPSLTSI